MDASPLETEYSWEDRAGATSSGTDLVWRQNPCLENLTRLEAAPESRQVTADNVTSVGGRRDIGSWVANRR